MPLHIAEPHITVNLGSSDLQFLPVLNPLDPSVRADGVHVRQTFRSESLDIDEKAKDSKGELYYEHTQLVFSLNEEYLESFSDSVRASAKHLPC